MDKRNGPCRSNSKHDCEREEVRGVNEKSPISRIRENGYHNPVKKYEMRRTFSQQTKSEENGCRKPHEPRRFFLKEKAQPKNNRQPAKRDIQRLDLNQPTFFYDADVCHPNQRREHRSFGSKTRARDSDERNGHCEH